jgi:DnaJ-class molecular chaperone
MAKRYCEMCDAWMAARECKACGAPTVLAARETCHRCDGDGEVRGEWFPQNCPVCGGGGTIVKGPTNA